MEKKGLEKKAKGKEKVKKGTVSNHVEGYHRGINTDADPGVVLTGPTPPSPSLPSAQ